MKGRSGELEPATIELSGNAVIVGAASVPSAPMASMRPYPYVLSGTLVPSGVAPACSAARICGTLKPGNAPRSSAATAPALGTDADVP